MILKLHETKIKEEDRQALANLFKELKTIRATIKTKKDAENAKAKIQELKSEIQSYAYQFFGATLQRGKDRLVIDWQETPVNTKDFVDKIKELNKKIRHERELRKKVKTTSKGFLYYNYTTTGGVFTKPGMIKALVGSVDEERKLAVGKKPPSFSKLNYVGVELEMLVRCSREYLVDVFCDAQLGRYVNIKSDGSIVRTESHPTPIEITVMASEAEIKGVIAKICELLKKKRIDATVNDSCGMHVHLDMRNRNPELCYNNLYYTQGVLLGMLPANRRSEENAHAARYCAKNESPDMQKQLGVGNRYRVINPQAFGQHRTLEVRVHSGTTNAMKINNWIDLLLSIVGYDQELKSHIKTVEKLQSKIKLEQPLIDYVIKRTLKFQDKTINTAADEKEAVA
jgi:hypothetical protein